MLEQIRNHALIGRSTRTATARRATSEGATTMQHAKPTFRPRNKANAAARQQTRRPASSDAPAITITNVTKRYKLGKENFVDALRGASIEVAAGEMVAIVGPSGSGKSTVMHMIGCLDTPDSGQIHINGRRVDNMSGAALTRLRGTDIGFVFQGFNLIPTLNAIDNVALPAEYAGVPRREAVRRAEELLALVGLGERSGHLPGELSGGQQQRVAIARALVNRPALVLGDEPTGDLDTATSDEIVAVMREINLKTGTTFVLVTHNPEVADACDRTISMRDGLVESDGYQHVAEVRPARRVVRPSFAAASAPA